LGRTGRSGGAGTRAFRVGCARCESDGSFVTRQFLLARYADERSLLATVSTELGGAGALVSFNGKSFDVPFLETRYLFHRLDWIGARLPHVDVLHPARRFWKPDAGRAFKARLDGDADTVVRPKDGGCSLSALERQVVGARRVGDVAGFEIPARYYQLIRTGNARPLVAGLEPHRLGL